MPEMRSLPKRREEQTDWSRAAKVGWAPFQKGPSPFPCFRVKSQQVGFSSERLSWPVLRLAAIAIVAWTQPKAAHRWSGRTVNTKVVYLEEETHAHPLPHPTWKHTMDIKIEGNECQINVLESHASQHVH